MDDNIDIVIEDSLEVPIGPITTAPNPKNKENEVFYSDTERRLVEEIRKFDKNELQVEMDRRPVPEYIDKYTNTRVVSANAKLVKVTDKNGKVIIVDNQEDIRLQNELNNGVQAIDDGAPKKPTLLIDEDDLEFED